MSCCQHGDASQGLPKVCLGLLQQARQADEVVSELGVSKVQGGCGRRRLDDFGTLGRLCVHLCCFPAHSHGKPLKLPGGIRTCVWTALVINKYLSVEDRYSTFEGNLMCILWWGENVPRLSISHSTCATTTPAIPVMVDASQLCTVYISSESNHLGALQSSFRLKLKSNCLYLPESI